ncbi:MAG: RNA methyltransferase [Candidatus Brocadiia bacterium]
MPDGQPIDSIKHPAVAEARQEVGEFRAADATAFLVDGYRLVSRALEADAPIDKLFFLEPVEGAKYRRLWQRALEKGIRPMLLTRGVFFKVLALGYETSVRVLAVVNRPASADATRFVAPGACLLVGEQIQDPRNVGVMVRTADACGAPCAVFTRDSADPWCRPAVRSSTGSIFRVPVALAANLDEYLGVLKGEGVRVIGTSAHADEPCWCADLSGPCALVLGNESVGVSDAVREVCDAFVTIPMRGGADSFNVTTAAAILLYEALRQRQPGGAR